jgi:hypothetical protein
MSRYSIIQTIKSTLDGLSIVVAGEPRLLRTTDTLIDPTSENELPIMSIVPGPETASLGFNGFAPLDCSFRLDMYGYVDGGSLRETTDERKSTLSKAAEDLVRAIKKALTDPLFLDQVQCAFSILQIGPYIVEHAELEEPFAYISMPLTIQYLDDVQTDEDE